MSALQGRGRHVIWAVMILIASNFGPSGTSKAADAFSYVVASGSATVTGCATSCPTNLVIPPSLGGVSVTAIGAYAFDSESITGLTIPTSVRSIGNMAFFNNQITQLTIGASVTSIGNRAFESNWIHSLTVAESVTSIGERAFAANYLTWVYFVGNQPTFGADVFSWSFETLEYIARNPVASGWVQNLAGIPVVAVVPPERQSQSITFPTIANRTLQQTLSFAVTSASSSGDPVIFSAGNAACTTGSGAENATVTIVDAGLCSITARQPGNYEWYPAIPVTRTFRIARTFVTNKVVTFVDSVGKPATGLKVIWGTVDGTLASAKELKTDSKGKIVFPRLPTGALWFSYAGRVGDWNWYATLHRYFHSISVPALNRSSAPLQMVVGADLDGRSALEFQVKVQLPDGSPVPGAKVIMSESYCNQYFWRLETCAMQDVTDSAGIGEFSVAEARGQRSVSVQFSDGEIAQLGSASFIDNRALVILEPMPAVSVEDESQTVSFGAAVSITAVAKDASGTPIRGKVLTLKAGSSGAAKTCTGSKTVATTNSSGRATFKVCPVKTATWSVDGRSIVGSAGVRLTVQLTPTAPRTLTATPNTRSVSLAWVVPVKANAGSVTDYIVQYRLQGATTWITFRDGTSTARKATITGLASGQTYEFRVAAKNRSGTGTWSVVVLRAAN